MIHSGIIHNLGDESDPLYFDELILILIFYEVKKNLICLHSPGAHIPRHLENQILHNLLRLSNTVEKTNVRNSRDAVIQE